MSADSTRRRLVPRAAIVATAVCLTVVVLAVAAASLVAKSRLVEVPDITRRTAEAAESAARAASLAFRIAGEQVSVDVPAGQVITQTPPPGAVVAPGTVIAVVLSVGPQTLVVPDLVGLQVADARSRLEAIGLRVTVQTTASETTSTIVLEMYPSPGATVSVGDEIRLLVPGEPSTDVLLPYDLSGLTVVLDPLPAATAEGDDPALDVARRLQSLLEAGGATVVVTRTATETAPTPVTRAAAARASGAGLLIGIDIGRTGTPGISVSYSPPVAGDPARSSESLAMAQSITRAARLPGFVVNGPRESTDVVLAGFPGTGVRVIVADAASESDRARMIDPGWADLVARAIYRGIGSRLGAD